VKGRPIDGRSDIFSLGVILYELVTGEKPFGGQNITTVIYKIINVNPPPPRELDATIHMGLSYVIQKALAKSPDERYQNCRELAEDLRNYKNLGGMPAPSATVVMKIPPTPAPTVQPPPPPARAPAAPAPEQVVRPMSVQVIPPAKPHRQGASPAVWILATLLVVGVLGGGYYIYRMRQAGQTGGGGTSGEDKKPPSPQEFGQLVVASNVEGARISIDGRAEPGWITPHTFAELPVGGHNIIVSKDGYDDASRSVTVEGGGTLSLNVELSILRGHEPPPPPPEPKTPPAPKLGQLVVTSNVQGARISIDGRSEAGWVTPHTFPDLAAGGHNIVVSKNGYDDANRSVSVEGGRTLSLSVELSTPRGEINIITVPAGFEILIDGQSYGPSPVRATLAAGPHKYTVKGPDGSPYEYSFDLKSGSSLTKTVKFSGGATAAPTGTVAVKTIPPGATVLADGAPVGGQTPTSFRLSAGRHTLTISLAGYRAIRREVDVPPDGLAEVNEKF
jgi:hypothetical protein